MSSTTFEDIDHSRTKTKSPQTNGICERFHKTVLNQFYRVAFRKKVYRSIDEFRPISICGSVIKMSSGLANPDRPGCYAYREGENDCSLITSYYKARPLNQAPNVRSSSS
jgi:hypothetical protein